MSRILSSYLSRQAELRDVIPAQTKAEIAIVRSAERQYERHLGAVAVAMQSALHAFDELTRADATVEVYRRWLVENPDEPRVAEAYRRAVADLIEASDWLDECLSRHRAAVRQAQQDAVQAPGAAA